MEALDTQIKIISDKIQQLLKKNSLLQKENEVLTSQLDLLKKKEENYQVSIDKLNQKVHILQTVSTGDIDKESKREMEKRISQYIKEIDKCIAILSE